MYQKNIFWCTNREWRKDFIIFAGVFLEHSKRENPTIESKKDPPNHTIMVEAKIESSINKKNNQQTQPLLITEMMRHGILTTCGDGSVKVEQNILIHFIVSTLELTLCDWQQPF